VDQFLWKIVDQDGHSRLHCGSLGPERYVAEWSNEFCATFCATFMVGMKLVGKAGKVDFSLYLQGFNEIEEIGRKVVKWLFSNS
jgi:hypothetical protein